MSLAEERGCGGEDLCRWWERIWEPFVCMWFIVCLGIVGQEVASVTPEVVLTKSGPGTRERFA